MSSTEKWSRAIYQPCLPIGPNGTRVTASEEHLNVSKNAAKEGIVLLKNNNSLLPFKSGTTVAIFGKAQIDYVRGGGGSGDVVTIPSNQLGVPLTLLRIKPGTEMAVVEMGASHPGDINELTNLGEPNFGMITNIGRAHLRDFGGYEGVIKTKNEMYQYIGAHNGLLFVNKDNELLMGLANNINKVTYGTGNDADIQGKMLSANPYLSVEWNGHKINTQLVGDYNFENVMAAICIGTHFKVAANDIVEALSSYCPTNNRSQVVETSKNRVIMDAYNANPTSMCHAIKNFRNICKDANLLILGDMRELGDESEQEHKTIIGLIKELGFKKVYLVGEEFSKCSKSSEYFSFDNVEELAHYLQEHPVSGIDILVKGSNSVHLNKIIDSL